MQDKEKYKNQPDDFSKRIRQKLEAHRMPVDEDCWSNIELQLKTKKKGRLAWWLAGSAAVAAVLLTILFFPQANIDSFRLDAPDTEASVDSISVQHNEIMNSTDDTANEPKKIEKDIKIIKSTGSVRLISRQASENVSIENGSSGKTKPVENTLLMIDTVQLAAIGNSLTIADTENESELPAADSVPSLRDKMIEEENKSTKILIEKTKKQDKWLLAASFSSGGNSSFGGRTYKDYGLLNPLPPTWEDSPNSNPIPNDDKILSYEDFTNINHSMPLSFGLSVRANLNDRIGLESGLIYTYLSSRFSKDGKSMCNAKQELHYLGIPVNVVVYLWNRPNWNVYVSAGGMVEKGLKMNYNQSTAKGNNPPSELSVKKNIDGLQWSINASVGVAYRFYKNWELYFEPRYSHFFDNDQPLSIRTENSQTVGISAGLRYEF
ncbi:MAG: porin family protein [Prevotella sp.]|nr:porin family protein [Prevotella sp.]